MKKIFSFLVSSLCYCKEDLIRGCNVIKNQQDQAMYLCLFFRLSGFQCKPNSLSTSPMYLSLDPAGIDAVGSLTPNTPVSITQHYFSPTPTVLQGHTTSNIQSSCPLTAFSPPRLPISYPSTSSILQGTLTCS